jgi:C4-dicarboxylate-specific signal transduction histidine kinase
VTVESEYSQDEPTYVGTIASMESVVANLVINAVSALDSRSKGERLIRVQTNVDEDSILLDVADNGPGIRNIDVDEIWLPGRSTTNRGVGLGLTIVRDIVADLDGNANVESNGDLGGAQFVIQIPTAER